MRAQQRREDPQQRGLAGAVGAEHHQRLALLERQRDPAERLAFAVAAREAVQLERRQLPAPHVEGFGSAVQQQHERGVGRTVDEGVEKTKKGLEEAKDEVESGVHEKGSKKLDEVQKEAEKRLDEGKDKAEKGIEEAKEQAEKYLP